MNFNSCKVKDISEELKIITQEKKRIADERGLIAEEKSENEYEGSEYLNAVEMAQLPVPGRLAFQAPRPVTRFNTSGYHPIPGELERLDRAGTFYMDVHHDNVETTVNATHWSEYLSIREMLYEVTKDNIFSLVGASPEKGIILDQEVDAMGV